MKTLDGETFVKPRSKKQWRLRIVEDCLRLLNTVGDVRSNHCYLVRIGGGEVQPYDHVYDDFEQSLRSCCVCAKGLLFLESMNIGLVPINSDVWGKQLTRKGPSFSTLSMIGGGDICSTKRLSDVLKYWDQQQLDMIESAFERQEAGVFSENLDCTPVDSKYVDKEVGAIGQKAIKFGKRRKNDKTRLRAILNNMLENDGFFCP